MAWCEAHNVQYVFGLAKNDRLISEIETELDRAEAESRRTGKPARRFKDFRWSTAKSGSCRRRVVAKAEWTRGEANPRFVVTSLKRSECKARYLYEKVYCARGDMENRIKECQLDLYADRTSTATMQANQLRLWFASMAYILLCPASHRTTSHPFRQGDLWYNSSQASQAWSRRWRQRPSDQIYDGSSLSIGGCLGSRSLASHGCSKRPRCARLTRAAAPRDARGMTPRLS